MAEQIEERSLAKVKKKEMENKNKDTMKKQTSLRRVPGGWQ